MYVKKVSQDDCRLLKHLGYLIDAFRVIIRSNVIRLRQISYLCDT